MNVQISAAVSLNSVVQQNTLEQARAALGRKEEGYLGVDDAPERTPCSYSAGEKEISMWPICSFKMTLEQLYSGKESLERSCME
jgi:hypothetical protein